MKIVFIGNTVFREKNGENCWSQDSNTGQKIEVASLPVRNEFYYHHNSEKASTRVSSS